MDGKTDDSDFVSLLKCYEYIQGSSIRRSAIAGRVEHLRYMTLQLPDPVHKPLSDHSIEHHISFSIEGQLIVLSKWRTCAARGQLSG